MNPNIGYTPPFQERECVRCHETHDARHYMRTKSPFYEKGYINICNDCIKDYLRKFDFSWDSADKLCQFLDIPFVPKEYERLREQFGEDAFIKYDDFFMNGEYESLSWKGYYEEFKKLQESGVIRDELPLLQDEHRQQLKEKWGFNYDDEALFYLEALYDGMLLTQNITGALQIDQALKLCKISYELDMRIRSGGEIDKLIGSYDKLVKTAEFTPKNVKNANDFDSVGELVKWLEKRGFKNDYYDGATRDIVDETIKNIQSYNRKLYTNETGIGEEINRRIEALNAADATDEDYFHINNDKDLDTYDIEGYDELLNEEFDPELGGDES